MYKAVLFDFFGVIVGRGFENTYRLAGGDPFKDRDSILDLLNQANLGLINDKEFNASIAKELNISVDVWFDSIKKSDATDYDLLSYIAELRKQYKTAILSNSNTGVIARRLDHGWLDKCFDEVIVSADVHLVKPDPAVYRLSADRLGVKLSECIFIDDRKAFADAANDVGMTGLEYLGLANLKQSLSELLN